MDRNLVAHYSEQQGVCYLPPDDAQADLSSLGTTQTTHNLLATHLYTSNSGISHADNTVTSHYAHLLARTFGNGLYNQKRIIQHIELNTYALKTSSQGLCKLLSLRSIGVSRMRVKL